MSFATYRYKAEPTDSQYASLRSARWHAKNYRNACLEERIASYGAAKAAALRAGREKPTAADWASARAPHAAAFLAWQSDKEDLLRQVHARRETTRREKAIQAFKDGAFGPVDERVIPWMPKTASDLGRAISREDQMRNLAEIRSADPTGIGRVPVDVLREHAIIVDEAFQAFFKRVLKGASPGFPRYKGFDQVVTLECGFGNGMSFERFTTAEGGSIIACRLKSMMWSGGLKVRMHRPLPRKPKRVSLTYDGRFWWICFLVEIEDAHVPHAMPGTIAGADVGVNRLVTLDDGAYFDNPRFLLAGAKVVAIASRRLAKAKRGSRARQKARKALSAAHRRVRNRRNTWRHTVAKRLVRTAETIVFEELKLRNMIRSASGTAEAPGTQVAQKRGLNRVLSDAGLAAIVNTTRHKAESAGGRVLLVDPRNSSLECSRCGTLSRKEIYEVHSCPACGLELHRDHNAAIVLRNRGLKILGVPHRPRRGARSTGLMEDAGRHRPSGPEKKGKHHRDDVASLAASGNPGLMA